MPGKASHDGHYIDHVGVRRLVVAGDQLPPGVENEDVHADAPKTGESKRGSSRSRSTSSEK